MSDFIKEPGSTYKKRGRENDEDIQSDRFMVSTDQPENKRVRVDSNAEPMMKSVDNDTYMLFPFTQDEKGRIVIDKSNEDASVLLDEVEKKLRNESEMTNLTVSKAIVGDIKDTAELLNTFIENICDVDFRTIIRKQVTQCFSELNDEEANNMLNETIYVHYGLFSYKSILSYLRYLIIGTYTSKVNDEMLYPLSFMSMKKVEKSEYIKIKEDQNAEWTSTEYHMIYNVCKSHKVNKKGICSHMMNIITNSKYASQPLILFVDETNNAAMSCYINNQFQKVKDIFSGKNETRPPDVYRVEGENNKNIYMCYNRHALKMTVNNEEGKTLEYEVMPVGTYRISLIAHGALDLHPTLIFEEKFEAKDHYKEFLFPFKNLQHYAKLGSGVSLMGDVDETTAIYDVCYDNIVSKYQDIPKNGIVSTIPLFFSGFKKDDPSSRENFIGLYDCNMKTRIKENAELFGKENNEYFRFHELIQTIYVYCSEKEIPMENVEIKVFACRGFCPVGEFAQTAKGGGDGENVVADVESVSDYQSMDKDEFFKYLQEEMSSCPLPQKGGDVLSGQFIQKLAKTPIGNTFTDDGKTYKVLENRHYKEMKTGGKKTRRKKNARIRKRKTHRKEQ